ncbi:class I SAM-dependent methyltransferase [Halobacteria archaeon AArc-curdl1]|uniref:Class I SAM-dependent methyltransferase n=1 Tax=Natronosalvus hydrolyticus TaxID=2979988 RepID=A0AAP2ZB74_9EURY|nr:class I SAM-dependent methyltransferase [Halobacteria archaeon AArc-curdl1]
MMDKEEILQRIPDGTKPLITKGFHIVSPTASWKDYKERIRARELTPRFFGGSDEWDRLESEFYQETDIVDIVMDAIEEAGDEKIVFDAHRGVCARLYAIIRKWEPETVVATGVYSGVATTAMLLGLEKNDSGQLRSIAYASELQGDEPDTALEPLYQRGRPSCSEHRSHLLPDGKEPGWIVPDRLCDRWEIYEGPSRERLPEIISDCAEIDLFYHDSELSTASTLFEFECAWGRLSDGGFIISPHIATNDGFDIFVDERECGSGVFYYDYLYLDEYDEPCSCGYIVNGPDPATGHR